MTRKDIIALFDVSKDQMTYRVNELKRQDAISKITEGGIFTPSAKIGVSWY